MNYLVMDGGTTNTRISLFRNDRFVRLCKIHVGAAKIKEIIREEISGILEGEDLREADVHCIMASGMITSELGLYEVAHISLPVNLETLSKSIKVVQMEDITSIPFCFIPGAKNQDGSDFMRGEETEFFGLQEKILYAENLWTILPGSHTKYILSSHGMIQECMTTLSGEMLSCLMTNTILKGSLQNSLNNINKRSLIDGYHYAKENGLNKALFYVRVLEKNFGKPVEELRGFFIGAVLSGDIDILRGRKPQSIAVGGTTALRTVFCYMIKNLVFEDVMDLGETSENMQADGALRIVQQALKNGNKIEPKRTEK